MYVVMRYLIWEVSEWENIEVSASVCDNVCGWMDKFVCLCV